MISSLEFFKQNNNNCINVYVNDEKMVMKEFKKII